MIISKRCKLKRIISFEFRHVKLAEKKGHEKTREDFVAISQAVYAHLPCSARCRSHSEIPSSPTRVTFVLDLRSNTWLLPRISYILDCKNSNRDTARLEQPDDPIANADSILDKNSLDRERVFKKYLKIMKTRKTTSKNIKVWYLKKWNEKKMSKITPTLLSQVSNRKFGNLGRSNNLFRDSKLLPLTFQLKTVKVMRILEMARVSFFSF